MKVETKQITAIQSDSEGRGYAPRLHAAKGTVPFLLRPRFARCPKSGQSPGLSVTLASLLAVCGVSVALVAGCGRSGNAVQAKHAGYTSTQWSRELFDFAVENLNHLEDNDCQELLRSMRERLAALRDPRLGPAIVRANALLASWPEPDMLRQVVSRLNQWVDTLEKPAPLAPDPMLATLPAEFRKLPMATEADLGETHFTAYDGFAARWRQSGPATWPAGPRAIRATTCLPRGISLTGRSAISIWTKIDRTACRKCLWKPSFWDTAPQWSGHGPIFCCCDNPISTLPFWRLPVTTPAAGKPAAKLTQWCVAVLIGDKDKKLYLFDPGLGLPIPTANGITAAKSGELDVVPATLDQVIANPKLLDRLAGDADSPYWVSKADLKHTAALVEASPLYIEPRAKRMEASLAGERKMVLSAEPSQQAERFKAAGVGDVRIWELPYSTLQRRMAMNPREVYSRLQWYLRLHRHWRRRESLQGPRPAPQRPLLRRKRRHRILPEGTAADARRNGPGSKTCRAILHGIDRGKKKVGMR